MILTILKVIGIILLVILLLILLLLSLILFAPIKYRFNGEYFDEPDIDANVRYFPVALNARVTFKENKLEYTIRMLGGVILTNTNAKLSWLGKKISPVNDDKTDNTEVNDTVTNLNEKKDEITNTNNSNTENTGINNDLNNTDIKQDISEDIKSDKKKKRKNNKNKQKLSDIISQKIASIKTKYNEIKNKLATINKKKDALIKVYHSKRFEKAKSDVIRYIKELLKVLKPKKLEGNIHFGLDDPAATGEVLGGLSVFLPIYDNCLTINPDFEKKIIEGIIKGNGTIYLCSIVKIALKILFNKNLIRVSKKVKTIIEA